MEKANPGTLVEKCVGAKENVTVAPEFRPRRPFTGDEEVALVGELDGVDASIVREEVLPVEVLGVAEPGLDEPPAVVGAVVDLPGQDVGQRVPRALHSSCAPQPRLMAIRRTTKSGAVRNSARRNTRLCAFGAGTQLLAEV